MTAQPPPHDQYPGYDTPPQPQLVQVRMPQGTPVVTYALLAITILFFVLQQVGESIFGPAPVPGIDPVTFWGMKINPLIVAGEWWRLFTPMLLHGSILHLGFNMYALYILGPGLERFYGSGRFLALYLLSGFAGNVMSFVMSPNPSLGSSTAIFGLLAAQGVFLYQHRELFGKRSSRALQNIIMVAGVNFVIGLSPGIDNWGHLGGFIGGAIFAWVGGAKMEVEGYGLERGLSNTRDSSQSLLAGALVAAIFGALAWFGMQ